MSEPRQIHPAPGWASQLGYSDVKPLTTVTSLEQAVDRMMIIERVSRYAWGFDERDNELLGDCFTADAVWEGSVMGIDSMGPVCGRDHIVAFMGGFAESQDDQRRHLFTNVVVDDLTAAGAVAHAYLLLAASQDASLALATAGAYRFEMAKEPDSWRICRLGCALDVPSL